MFENFPYSNFHDLNLDWLIQKVKEAYSPDNPPDDIVLSVNGESGEVVLYKGAVVTLPDVEEGTWNIHRIADGASSGIQFIKGQKAQRIDGVNRYDIYDSGNPPTYPVSSVNGQTGSVILYRDAVITFPEVNADTWNVHRISDGASTGIQFKKDNPAQRINGTSRYDMYDAGNPPPYPVTSVNGQTGAVSSVNSVNTLKGDVVILNTSVVTDQGVQKLQITFPVTSVDGKTGAVETWAYDIDNILTLPVEVDGGAYWGFKRDINAGDLGIRLEYDSDHDTEAAYITFDDGVNTPAKIKLLTAEDIPSSSGVVSFNGQTGAITCTGHDIEMSSTDTRKVDAAVDANTQSIEDLQDSTASEWDITSNYMKGQYVMKDGVLYKATANNMAGAWSTQSWSAAVLANDVKSKAPAEQTFYVEDNNYATRNYSTGDYILIQGELKKAIANISNLDAFSASNVVAVTNLGAEVSSLNDHIDTFDPIAPKTIPSNYDADTLTNPGAYSIMPDGNFFESDVVYVYSYGGRIIQMLIQPYDGTVKIRAKRGTSAWGAWTTLFSAGY